MNQIKNKNIISSKLISINYNNENEGLILIGKYPHDIYPTKYKNKRLKTFYPNKANIASLSINFYEIYTINNNEKIIIEKNINSNLLLNIGLIVGTNEYMKFIENTFFNQFIFKNICRKNYGSTGWEDFTIFSWIESEDFQSIKFTLLFFSIKSSNLLIELNFNDLFKKIDNRYYFLIIFENYENSVWKIGKPLYLKYNFVYDCDKKIIGIYNENNINKNETDIKKEKNLKIELNSWKIVIIIVLFLIFISLIIIIAYFFGKRYNIIRKKHANELNDEYDYISSISNSKYKYITKDINKKNDEMNNQHIELSNDSKIKELIK